jgi:hypothetical protein
MPLGVAVGCARRSECVASARLRPRAPPPRPGVTTERLGGGELQLSPFRDRIGGHERLELLVLVQSGVHGGTIPAGWQERLRGHWSESRFRTSRLRLVSTSSVSGSPCRMSPQDSLHHFRCGCFVPRPWH